MKYSCAQILKLIILTLVFPSSCRTKEDLVGTYVSRNNVNTIDSLFLFIDGNYQHNMYRLKDKGLIYKNTGSWTFEDGFITLNKFYIDEDDIHSEEEGNFENVLITTKLPIETRAGRIVIYHLQMNDQIYLEKLK